jgi:hypothetical protein
MKQALRIQELGRLHRNGILAKHRASKSLRFISMLVDYLGLDNQPGGVEVRMDAICFGGTA